jgi:hypothetical protein
VRTLAASARGFICRTTDAGHEPPSAEPVNHRVEKVVEVMLVEWIDVGRQPDVEPQGKLAV